MKKVALITGVTGQDGAYLAEFLLNKDYEVHGMKRRTSLFNTKRIDHLYNDPNLIKKNNFYLHYGDMSDSTNLIRIINEIKPDEIYNLAAMSHVRVSFDVPEYVGDVDGLGTLRILEAVRILGLINTTKIYQASTSELFGKVQEIPQSETTPFYPRSPYGVAKLYAYWITKNYRESYGIYASNGILFNHESPLRGETFVTRKISRAVGRIHHQLQSKLTLGNLNAARDWGFAGDYVKGMYLMMQHDNPDDWVLATGEAHTVKEFAEEAFNVVGMNWEDFVVTSKDYERPNEVKYLLGDSSKAKSELNWEPETNFKQLVKMMVENDLKLAEQEKVLLDNKLITPTWENPI